MNKEQIVISFGTILEMLRDRHVSIPQGLEKAHMIDVLSSETVLKPVVEVKINKIKVIYYTPQKFKWADIKKHFEDDEAFETYILVVNETVTPNNMKSITSMNKPVEVHLVSRLQFNITKHFLVPKHEVIQDKDIIDMLTQQYKLKSKTQFPIILKTDPIAKYYGMRTGDLVKITRTSETAGEYVIYRCCL